MNRPFKSIITATTLLLLIFSYRPAAAQPSQLPHENPSMVSGTVDAVSLLRFYSNISGLIANREYEGARNALSGIQAGNIPASIKQLIDSGMRLARNLGTTMNDLEFLLDTTSRLFRSGDVDQARQTLIASEDAVGTAVLLASEFTSLSKMLGAEVGALTNPESPIAELYQTHMSNLETVEKLILELDDIRAELDLDPTTSVDSKFYSAVSLEVFQIEEVEPGVTILIDGNLHLPQGDLARIIEVYLDEVLLTREEVSGEFTLEIPLPSNIEAGQHSLTVVVTSEEDDAGTARHLTISLHAPIGLEIQTSWLVGIRQTTHVEGEVLLGFDPLPNAQLRIELGDNSLLTETDAEGRFSADMEIPFNLTLAGPETLRVTAGTLEGDYAPATVTKWVLVANPLYSALLLVVFVIAAWFTYRKLFVRTASPIAARVVLSRDLTERPAPYRSPELNAAPQESDTARDRVLAAYLKSVETVRVAIGTAESPSMTLREYARTVALQRPQIGEPFADLTSAVETVLYSTRSPDDNTANRAETSAGMIRQEMTRGAA